MTQRTQMIPLESMAKRLGVTPAWLNGEVKEGRIWALRTRRGRRFKIEYWFTGFENINPPQEQTHTDPQ